MLRDAKKSEVTRRDRNQIVQDWLDMDRENDEHGFRYSVIWVPKARRTLGRATRGYGGFYTLKMNGDPEGTVKICEECGELYVSIAGNCVEDLEYCWECGAKCYDD